MITLGLLATSIGCLLGLAPQRVSVLLPAGFIVLIATSFFSVATDLDGWQMAATGILGIVGLQTGYLAAVFGKSLSNNETAAHRAKPFAAFGISRFV